MNGDKEALLLMKKKSPRCFENKQNIFIPHNFPNSWMTSTIFKQWLKSGLMSTEEKHWLLQQKAG